MKRFVILLLLLILSYFTTEMGFAYSVKIFDKTGKQIGTAHKSGEDYVIYDINAKQVVDFDAFYSVIDTEPVQYNSVPTITPGQKWLGVGKGVNLKTVRTNSGKKIKFVRSGAYYTNNINIKVYDRTGKFIGYAKTDGTSDYIIYDKNGNVLNINIPLYSPPGKPLGSYWDRYSRNRKNQNTANF